MFKRRFAEWGIERKFKNREVKYMLVMEHLRRSSGKGTRFLLHGRQVNSDDLRRYVGRKQMKISEVLEDFSNGQVQPYEWIQCQTPRSPSPCLLSTRQHKAIEDLFYTWRKLILGSLSLDLCFPGETGLVWIYHDHENPEIFQAFDVFQSFVHYSRASMGAREMLLLRCGCLLMESAISCSSFLWWIGVVGVIAILVHSGRVALARILLAHIDGLARAKLDLGSPHNFFLRQLTNIPLEEFVPLTTQLFQILIDVESSISPDDSSFSWQSRVDLWTFSRRHSHGDLGSDAFELLQEGLATYGPSPENKMREALIDEAFWAGLDLKTWYSAQCLGSDLPLPDWDHPFENAVSVKDVNPREPLTLVSLGCECFNRGDLIGARLNWTNALAQPPVRDLSMDLDSSSIHYVLEYLDYLSTQSAIADGNLSWRSWKSDIEAAWQLELDMACSGKAIPLGSLGSFNI